MIKEKIYIFPIVGLSLQELQEQTESLQDRWSEVNECHEIIDIKYSVFIDTGFPKDTPPCIEYSALILYKKWE